MNQLFFICLFFLSVAACQKNTPAPLSKFEASPAMGQSDEHPTESPKEDLANASDGPLSLSARPIGLSEPNQYQIKISWTAGNEVPNTGWRIERKDLEEARMVGPEKTDFIDTKVQAGQTYQYQVSLMNSPNGLSDTIKIIVPTDVLIQEPRVLNEPVTVVNFNRVFFTQEGSFITNGNELKIIAREIISQGGSIKTFSDEDQNAVESIPGKHGGKISVKAIRAEGKLTIRATGQNGGHGENAKEKDSLNGSNGEQGHTGYFSMGKCTTGPGSGRDGQDGASGDNGLAGKAGGNSANVSIIVEDSSKLDLDLTVLAGVGGLGGAGGPGGRGGNGGLRGPIRDESIGKIREDEEIYRMPGCLAFSGRPGRTGQRGPNGQNGSNGQTLPYLLRLIDQESLSER